jgi:hypothetical protein
MEAQAFRDRYCVLCLCSIEDEALRRAATAVRLAERQLSARANRDPQQQHSTAPSSTKLDGSVKTVNVDRTQPQLQLVNGAVSAADGSVDPERAAGPSCARMGGRRA